MMQPDITYKYKGLTEMKLIKLRALDPRGIAHFVLPLLVIAIIGIIGTYMVVSSSANDVKCSSPNGQFQCETVSTSAADCSSKGLTYDASKKRCVSRPASPSSCPSGTVYSESTGKCHTPAKPAAPKTKKPTTAEKRDATNTKKQEGNTASSNATSQIGSTPNGTNPAVQTITYSSNVPPALAPYVKKAGNVIIVTYVDHPKLKSDGNKDRRLGSVKVKLEKIDGSIKCTNRKSGNVTTNGLRYKKGTQLLVRGTVHFNNCETGQYKATLVGRNGYVPADNAANIKIFDLNDNETKVVSFVMKKGDTGP